MSGRTRLAFFGDVVGKPGREAFAHAARVVRAERGVDVIVVNGENARHGMGLHPAGYAELRGAGADVVTLGDHAMDEPAIAPLVTDPDEPLIRPVNIAAATKAMPGGQTSARVKRPNGRPTPIYVATVSGRVHMKHEASDPFAASDRVIAQIAQEHADALVIIEIHAEITSEKTALAWHCAERHRGRVVGVFGSHTHVPTADARIDRGVAAVTDLGMCGGHGGVIGFDAELSIRRLIRQSGGRLEPTERHPAATGVIVEIDHAARAAVGIEAVRIGMASAAEPGGQGRGAVGSA